ncbi:WzyE family oligosaccharide polymerase [Escherichia coli]
MSLLQIEWPVCCLAALHAVYCHADLVLSFAVCALTSMSSFHCCFCSPFSSASPLTSVLVFRFDVGVAPPESVVGVAFCGLLLRGLLRHLQMPTKTRCRLPRCPLFTMNRVQVAPLRG